ncbi:hypothetical protein ACE193_01445 [Bernardetia sp. OM2101]|uniref:hypothetical protein n=1 Tax=Bernardetia sp. OM2101 TaxID=3344876 RepID=UPI0035D13448
MENLDRNVFEEPSHFGMNSQSKELLKSISFWTKFIAILGLIATSAIFFGAIVLVINRQTSIGRVFFYWVLSLFSFVPLIYLFKFSKKSKECLLSSDEATLQKTIQSLRSYFKSIGVSMILIFSVFLLEILGMFIYYSFFK